MDAIHVMQGCYFTYCNFFHPRSTEWGAHYFTDYQELLPGNRIVSDVSCCDHDNRWHITWANGEYYQTGQNISVNDCKYNIIY